MRIKHPIDLAPGDRAPKSAILAELMEEPQWSF